ncbi:MAG: DUF1015 domain-containing protein [Anaerolineaceae bacterium]|nr:DUF1015 domain-containing protein [Anaerolineaceae bacterium]
MTTYPDIGVQIPHLLLPKSGLDLTKWAVIACDQFTSQPEYWQQVEALVGDAPSTLNMILPEIYLESPDADQRIRRINAAMQRCLDQQLLESHAGIVLAERSYSGRTRHGILLALDLERYSYQEGSQSLIRATEGTILVRLPPRIRIRSQAPLELPHILVLIDDPGCTVIEPLVEAYSGAQPLYDFELMLGSGRLRAHLLQDPQTWSQVHRALAALADPQRFSQRYGVGADKDVLLFAMGDGNHSFATAKSIWDQKRQSAAEDHPARYALVEIVNVHDHGLEFEPIHRVLFGVSEELPTALQRRFGERCRLTACANAQEMVHQVLRQGGDRQHSIGFVSPSGCGWMTISQPSSNLPVGTLQEFLDDWLQRGGAERIDYVHGEDVVTRLGSQPGNLGFYLPPMPKTELFKTVILDGALPRKTFSMGEAKEKRFYLECRLIT